MQNALKVIEVSGEDLSTETELETVDEVNEEWEPEVEETKTKSQKDSTAIFISVHEINTANMMVASLERSRLDPFRREIESIETLIAETNKKLSAQRERLAKRKAAFKLATKNFSKIQFRLEKLTNAEMGFDEFVTKLHG